MELSPEIRDAVAAADAAGHAVKGSTSPNPPVGAVILDAEGNIVGTGGTRPAGGDRKSVV